MHRPLNPLAAFQIWIRQSKWAGRRRQVTKPVQGKTATKAEPARKSFSQPEQQATDQVAQQVGEQRSAAAEGML